MKNEKNRRDTKQRKVILEELRKLTSHPTASTMYEIVRRQLPKISLGTVYRNLELLTELGMIQKLEASSEEARFDGNPAEHFHVRCMDCGRVDDLLDVPPDFIMSRIKEFSGYKIYGYKIEFSGSCPDCRSLSIKPHQC